jgi:tight adherence protein C
MHLAAEHPLVTQVVVFLLVAGGLMAICSIAGGKGDLVDERLRGLIRQPNHATDDLGCSPAMLGAKRASHKEGLQAAHGKHGQYLQTHLIEAGIHNRWAPSAYIAARLSLACALPAACFTAGLWVGAPWAYTGLSLAPSAIIGMYLPCLWLDSCRAKRHTILRRALPDFLDLVVACLGAGMSVQAALKQVADELRLAHPALSAELSVVLREIELGRTLDQGLQQLAARTGMEELRTLCSFVYQASRYGSTITDALQQLGEMLRIQREQRAEELAQKAAVKILFPTLLFIFPTIFVVLAGPAAIQINEGLTGSQRRQAAFTQSK